MNWFTLLRGMDKEARLCSLGLRGCAMHRRSGFYVPLWRDLRRWYY